MKKSILYLGSIFAAVALVFASAGISQADTTINSAGTTLTTVEPAISNVAVANSTDGTSATITWTTDEPSTSELAYGTSSPVVTSTGTTTSTSYSSTSPVDSTMVNNHSVTLSGLTPGTAYHFQIISSDISDNTTSSSDQTFTTNGTAPITTASTTAPMISSIGTSNSSDGTSSVITWVTDEPSTSQVSYGLTAGSYTASTAADPTLVTSHSVTLSGLTPNTSYHFIVSSANNSAMMSTSTDQAFTTNPGTSTATTAATTTTANFVLTATTSNTSFTTGSPISITATADNTGADIGQGIVSVEVYDSSNNRVFDQAFNQDFSTNNPLSYTISFTPSNSDTYTVKIGTFSSNWSQNYAWNNNALSFTVSGSSISSTSTTSTTTTSTSGTSTSTSTSYPNMTLTPSSQTVSAGQHVDFNGRNFPHEENINVYQNGTLVGNAHADGGGNFTTGSMIMPNASGTYTYTFVGATTGAQMSSTITVQ